MDDALISNAFSINYKKADSDFSNSMKSCDQIIYTPKSPFNEREKYITNSLEPVINPLDDNLT